MSGCECCGGPLGCLDHTLCQRCLIWVPDAATALGHAIARFVRRAEVAGLVEEARHRHHGECGWWDDDPCNCSANKRNAAVLALARLAGGGA